LTLQDIYTVEVKPMRISDPRLWLSCKGRLNRQPYFLGASLTGLALRGLAEVLEQLPQGEELAQVLPFLAVFSALILTAYIFVALGVKRSHDLGKSGWFALLLFVPLVQLWPVLELNFVKGAPGPNRFGEDPLQAAAPPVVVPNAHLDLDVRSPL
jgi:uncharacterized membrane protein YhaH (DUF805 family)